MKTNLKALAQHYRVSYKSLRDVVANLNESVIQVSRKGCTVFDVEALEAAIAHLPRRQEPEPVAIELFQPDDSDIVEAEIVEEECNTQLQALVQAHQQNQKSLVEITKQVATQQGKELAQVYRETLTKVASEGVSQAQRDVLGILGK